MSSVLICNRERGLSMILKKPVEPFRFLNLSDDAEGFRMANHLRRLPEAQELSKTRLLRERNQAFREKFPRLIGELNIARPSIQWWGMSFTNKDPYGSTLCREVAYFLLVTELSCESEVPLLVIINSVALGKQIKAWSKRYGVKFAGSVAEDRPIRGFLKRHTPAGTIKAAARLAGFWASSRRYRPSLMANEKYVVIATHTHPRSFTPDNGYQDVYFGDLVEMASASSTCVKAMVLGYMLEQPAEQFKKLKNLNFGLPVLPLETYFTLSDLASCIWQSLRLYLRPIRCSATAEIDGVDVGLLIEQSIEDARDSGEFLQNLHVYYCAKRLAQKVDIARCLYPFENRSWEKMLLLGVRAASPNTKMIGYQHTSITPGHTNLLLGEGEANVTPLPESVLTTGEVTREWLERDGGFPAGMFKAACALRPGQGDPMPVQERKHPINRLLVVLATSLEEYINTFVFLNEAFSKNDEFDVRIRPHPSLTHLQTALDLAPLYDREFYTESTGPLGDALQWADLVLYGSSTVCLEAVSQGIPAVYLDLGFFFNTDPMADWNELKWAVKEPSDLMEVIRRIESLPEETFQGLQQKGQEYAQSYLSTATPNRIAAFWED